MNYYISEENVLESINYFKTSDFEKGNNLFLYLICKHYGMTNTFPVNFRSGTMSATQKKDFNTHIWMMGGIFDTTEKCERFGVVLPSSFPEEVIEKTSQFLNGGTPFKGQYGRFADAIKQIVNTFPIWNYNDGVATLKYNYKEVMQDQCLHGSKISLSNLAAWVFRFTAFDFEVEPTQKEFSRVIEKIIKKYFKITKNDFLWLFENDLSMRYLAPRRSGISGTVIRNQFSFGSKVQPEIEDNRGVDSDLSSVVSRDTIDKYIAISGDNPSDADIIDILKSKKQIVLTGVPGVGKSRFTDVLAQNSFFSEHRIIQFHAGYSYEDFIGGETLEEGDKGSHVVPRKGVFLDFANEAVKAGNTKNYLFIIDELNRGNIAEIFGETILALDRNYTVQLTRQYEDVSELHLPDNFYIVATMNTSDRNIAFLDLAIRRRFAFVPLTPNYEFLSDEVKFGDYDLGIILRKINQRILDTLKDPELILGQAYFIPPKTDEGFVWEETQFKNQFNFVILPTLVEYSFNEPSAVNTIVGEQLGDSIQDTDEFMAAFNAEFSV